jgi:alpha-1,3-glucosyltransferase
MSIPFSISLLLPFLLTEKPIEQLQQIAHRLFPFARGLFEDKVSNVWCILHIAVKVKNILTFDQQLKLATGLTLITSILPCLKLLKDQS